MKLEYAITKPVDDYCSTVELFRGVLCSNKRIVFKNPDDKNQQPVLLFDGRELKHCIESTPVQEKEVIFHMIIEADGDDEEQAKTLEQFDDVIKELIRKVDYQFTINTLWNDVTTYYGKRLYPEISHVENMLRKIIYLFMLKTVGRDWLNTDAPEKFREKIYSVMDKNKIDYVSVPEDCLSYADFITLGYFFTAP